MCQLASKDWRFDLERGKMIDAAAELAWKQAAQPILVQDDPFNALMRSLDAEMEELVRLFVLTRNPLVWSDRFVQLLTDFHEQSHLLGQGRNAIQPLAQSHAYQVMNIGRGGLSIPEADFVLGFLNDLIDQDPRYFKEGEVVEEEILRRMRMYQGKMRGSAGWGFVDPKPPLAEFYWRLGGTEAHCEDCPLNANKSPWYKETLYTTPGAGDTPCLFNCVLDGEALVATARGEVPISQVRPGDYVLTHRGRFKKVKAAWTHVSEGPKRAVAVVNPDGSYVRLTADHRLFTDEGWASGDTALQRHMYVRTHRYEDLRQMRIEDAFGQEGDVVRKLRAGLPLRETQRPPGGRVPVVLEQANGIGSVVGQRIVSNDPRGIAAGRGGSSARLRGLDLRSLLLSETGRQVLHLLLGGRAEALSVPFPVGVGSSEWPDTEGSRNPSQERRSVGRQVRELGMSHDLCPSTGSYVGGEGRDDGQGTRGQGSWGEAEMDVPDMRNILPGLREDARGAAKVLFTGVLRPGQTLYDLQVEDDESFVVEGVVVHNCLCWLEEVESGEISVLPVLREAA